VDVSDKGSKTPVKQIENLKQLPWQLPLRERHNLRRYHPVKRLGNPTGDASAIVSASPLAKHGSFRC